MTGENCVQNARRELAKTEASLREARALASLGMWDGAVSRAYYAAFHAANALLVSAGLQARTHAVTHDLLLQHFVRNGVLSRRVSRDLAALQTYRGQADYSAEIRFDAATGGEEVERAAGVVAEITALLLERGVSG